MCNITGQDFLLSYTTDQSSKSSVTLLSPCMMQEIAHSVSYKKNIVPLTILAEIDPVSFGVDIKNLGYILL